MALCDIKNMFIRRLALVCVAPFFLVMAALFGVFDGLYDISSDLINAWHGK